MTRRGLLIGAAAIVVVSGVAVSMRGPSPEDPGQGELTAVFVKVQDQAMIGGEGVATHFSAAVVLTEQEMLDAYAASWPGSEQPKPYQYGFSGFTIAEEDLAPLEAGGRPPPGPALASVVDGRLRIPWSGEPRYLCPGRVFEGVVRATGCVFVDRQPPAAITLGTGAAVLGLVD